MAAFLPVLTMYLVLILPAVPLLIWSRYTAIPGVKKLLIATALAGISVVSLVCASEALLSQLCYGSIVKGYTSCRFVPQQLADQSGALLLLLLAVAVWVFGVTVICVGQEYRRYVQRREAR